MKRMKEALRQSIVGIALVALLPIVAVAVEPWDPGNGLYPNYMHGTVLNSNHFPIYIINYTPYPIQRSGADIHDWFLPRTIPPKGMGVGFINNWFITDYYLISEPKPLDRRYVFTIMEGDSAGTNPEFAIHIIRDVDINPADPESVRSGIYKEIMLWDKIIGGYFGMLPEVGVFVRAAKTGIALIVDLIKKIDKNKKADCDFYMFGYGLARAADCQSSVTYYKDYCTDPAFSNKCTNQKAHASFDAAYTNTNPVTCFDMNDPQKKLDPSTKYVFGNVTFSGASFFNDNDPKKPYTGTQGPFFTLSIYLAQDWHAGYQQILAEQLQAAGYDRTEPKLQTLFDSIIKHDMKTQSALMEKIGIDKAGKITNFLQTLSQGQSAGLPQEKVEQLDQILSWLK